MSLRGELHWAVTDPDGNILREGHEKNTVTLVGQQMYLERAAGASGAPAAPTGMKLGTGSTAPATTGAGSALVTYLPNSQQAFDASYPQGVAQGAGRRVIYQVTYAAGKATSSGAITEAVIVNEALADATSASAATVARILVAGIGSKSSTETLTLTWTHDLAAG
jgi:hypothetical protein